MKYRELGKTGLKASEISLGAEWIQGKTTEEAKEIISFCEKEGINLMDCWMSEPKVRSDIGLAIKDSRDKWIIQEHIGSIWQDNQYVKTREMDKVIESYDQMARLGTDYLDFGMIPFVDDIEEFKQIMNGEFIEYVRKLKNEGTIKHIGLSTHHTKVALLATEYEEIELIMFSINPAFDMVPGMTIEEIREDGRFSEDFRGIDSERANFYQICEDKNIAITVMKGFSSGTLFNKETSPFSVALTPVHCIEYALSQKSVASILIGVESVEQVKEGLKYETATDEEKNYASVLVNAPLHSYKGQCLYCGHCSPCSSEIDIAMVHKYYDLAKLHDEIPESIRAHYNDLSANAEDCIECRDCEERRPFDVKIVENMNLINKFFGG